MTPLQFQKQLRLLEARRLIVTKAANVAEAAYKLDTRAGRSSAESIREPLALRPNRML